MSTNIYHGFRFPSTIQSMAEVQDWHHKVGTVMKQAALDKLADHILTTVLGWLDLDCAVQAGLFPAKVLDEEREDGYDPSDGWVRSAVEKLRERQKTVRVEGRRDPAIDVSASVVVLTAPDGQLYGLHYIENRELLATFHQVAGVEPWGYWNNTDQPDEITDEDWEVRAKLWDTLLGDGAAAQRGMTLLWVGEDMPVWREHIEACTSWSSAQMLDTRARDLALRIARNGIEVDMNSLTLSQMMSVIRQAEKGVTDKDVAAVRRVLLEEVSPEDLLDHRRDALLARSMQQHLGVDVPAAQAVASKPRL